MINRLKYLIILALPVLFLSCRNFSFSNYLKGDALATVEGKSLYLQDVESIFTPGLTPEDSLALLNSYVEMWVKQQLKIRQAERVFPQTDLRISQMVDDYRNSLIIYEYEKLYLEENMDTVISNEDIRNYFEENTGEFRLSGPMIKGLVVPFPVTFRQEAKIRELAQAGSPEQIQDLIDLAIKNDMEYQQFTDWTDLREVVTYIPRVSENEVVQQLGKTNLFETTLGEYRYLLVITGYLNTGSVMPLNMAAPAIQTTLMNRKRQDALKQMEDQLYHSAVESGDVTINIE